MAVILLTAITLIAFAANSVLCRIALRGELIDPISFTTIRLVAAALVLPVISWLSKEPDMAIGRKSWRSGLALFAYAITFSLAYISLSAGTGALLLFGAVQLTMLGAAIRNGERLNLGQCTGLAIAVAGLLYLLLPGASTPNPLGASLMILAGIAWGIYSIFGKGVSAPIAMTTRNFLWAAPMGLAISCLTLSRASFEARGVMLATVSGVFTSGMGYVVWYKVLPKLTTAQAAMLQLLVPPLATFGGIVFIAEQLTTRIVVSSSLILGGVGYAVLKKAKQ